MNRFKRWALSLFQEQMKTFRNIAIAAIVFYFLLVVYVVLK